MSLRSASTIARNMFRPMRPNPLMATRTDIARSFFVTVTRGLDPRVHLFFEKDGLPGQARP
jgi:hypothetical protein